MQASLHANVEVQAALSPQAIDPVKQFKEQRGAILKTEGEAAARNGSELIWKYPMAMEDFRSHHPDHYSSVFDQKPPAASRITVAIMTQQKASAPAHTRK